MLYMHHIIFHVVIHDIIFCCLARKQMKLMVLRVFAYYRRYQHSTGIGTTIIINGVFIFTKLTHKSIKLIRFST